LKADRKAAADRARKGRFAPPRAPLVLPLPSMRVYRFMMMTGVKLHQRG
jgi:hypothetical protein